MNAHAPTIEALWKQGVFHANMSRGETVLPNIFGHKLDSVGIQAGNPNVSQREHIGELVRLHSNRLFLIILRMVQSYSVAEDILQDTWMKVVKKLHQHDPERPYPPWLTQIAVNRCRDYWRKTGRQESINPVGTSDKIEGIASGEKQDIQAKVETRESAQRALLCLSPKLREVIVLKFYSGFNGDEIAGILKLPVGTVKSRLNSALEKMRSHLGHGEDS
ncbi:RNA polymerase sigma factor [Acidobacteriota bacterium]